MALLDAYGRPIAMRTLTEPQGEAGVVGVRPVDLGTVAAGLTPRRLAATLADCDRGDIRAFMILAEEMEERDPHYASVLGQRKRAISGIDATVTAAGEGAREQRIAEWVREHIVEHDDLPTLIEDLLDAVAKGFSAVNVEWGRSASAWWPRAFHWRHQSHFRFDRETGRELRLLEAGQPDGVPLAPGAWIVHRSRIKSGATYRGGVARIAVFSWMCKAYAFKDWMAFVECYGLPLRLGRYGPGATREDIATLFRAVANIGTDAAAVIPESMGIEFPTVGGAGAGEPAFENLARFCDEQLSKIVVGQTMTADSGSSMAQAKVHNDVRYDIAAADARQIEGVINRDLVRTGVMLNFGAQARYPKVDLAIAEPEDVAVLSKAVADLAAAGLPFGASSMRRRFGFQDPQEGEETFGGAPAAAAPPPAATARLATARAQSPWDGLDALEAEMAAEWRPAIDPMIAPILAAAEASATVEEFDRRLAAMEGLPKGPLIDQLVRGMFRARALGDGPDV